MTFQNVTARSDSTDFVSPRSPIQSPTQHTNTRKQDLMILLTSLVEVAITHLFPSNLFAVFHPHGSLVSAHLQIHSVAQNFPFPGKAVRMPHRVAERTAACLLTAEEVQLPPVGQQSVPAAGTWGRHDPPVLKHSGGTTQVRKGQKAYIQHCCSQLTKSSYREQGRRDRITRKARSSLSFTQPLPYMKRALRQDNEPP